MASATDDDVNEVGHAVMTLVSTSCLEADANASQISLTDEEVIQYMTIEVNANNTNGTKGNEGDKTGNAKVTPSKKVKKSSKKTPKKEGARDDDDSSSTSSRNHDASVFSDNGDQQPSKSGGFKGWSDDDAEGNKGMAVANIIVNLEQEEPGCQDSGVGMGSDDMKPKFVGILRKVRLWWT